MLTDIVRFDSSISRGEPFKTVIGDGKVIKGALPLIEMEYPDVDRNI